MNLKLNLSQKALILVAVPLAFELLFVATLSTLLIKAQQAAIQQENAKDTVVLLHDLNRLSFEAGSALVTYGLTRQASFSARFSEIAQEIRQDVHSLRTKVINNPPQLLRAIRLDLLEQRLLSFLESKMSELESGRGLTIVASRDFPTVLKSLSTSIIAEVLEFAKGASAAETESTESRIRSDSLVLGCLAGGVVLNIILAVWLAIFFNRGTTRRLSVLMDNTDRLANQRSLNPPIDGSDEIASLDQTFHMMALALSEAMRRERAAVDNAIDVICSLDRNGKFEKINPACQLAWGYTPDELNGRELVEIVAPEDAAETKRFIKEATIDRPHTPFENRIVKPDGSPVDLLWSAHWSEQESVLFCVVHNMTERKELERLKREFVAMVSHDLRTPLSALQLLLALLSEGAYGQLSETGEKRVVSTTREVDRLIRMINDLLDIEKMESGKLEMDFAEVEIYELMLSANRAISSFAESFRVSLTLIPSELKAVVDKDRLIQVIVNLISNAIKFSPPDSAVIVEAEDGGEHVIVRVTDRGRGVPPELRSQIFERFRQVERADAKQKKGTGLGLTICKTIIEGHCGEIGVDSEEGKGSSFWFRIPKRQN